MTQTQQPEALRLAEQCDNFDTRAPIAACLRAQHARIQELEMNLVHRQEVYTASLEQIVCLQDRIQELEQGKCLHQIAEPAAAPQSALVEALRAVCTDMVAVGNGQHAITDAARDKVEALQGLLFSEAPQAVQPAVPLPTVELIGVKDGKETNLGQVPMPPTMRARELLRDVGFTGLDDDDGEGAYAMGACEQLIEYCQAYFAAPAHPAEGVPALEVNDAMALAFHHALTDGSIGADDLEEIKIGLRAVLANVAATQPAAQGD